MGHLMARAREIREFVVALEALWSSKGEDVSESSPRGQRPNWMRQQADRLDPLVDSPSVLDRRQEIRRRRSRRVRTVPIFPLHWVSQR